MFNKLKRYWRVLKYIYNQGAEGLDERTRMYERIEKERYQLYGNNTVVNSTIGKHSYLAHNAIAFNATIGNYCSIGPNVVIGYGDHPTDKLSTNPLVYYNVQLYGQTTVQQYQQSFNKRVYIGNDVWIGANVFIKNGITIDDGAIIGAGAVVLKDIPSYSIAVGAPARIIRQRFDEDTIAQLKASKWWEKDIETLIAEKTRPEIKMLLELGK